jgi:hypothetical protein
MIKKWLIVGGLFGLPLAVVLIITFWTNVEQSVKIPFIIKTCLLCMVGGLAWGLVMYIYSGIILKLRKKRM